MSPPRNAVKAASAAKRNTRLNQYNKQRAAFYAQWRAEKEAVAAAAEAHRKEYEAKKKAEANAKAAAAAKAAANAAAKARANAKAAHLRAYVASMQKPPRAEVRGRFVVYTPEPLQRRPAVRQNRKSGPRPKSPRRRLLERRFVSSLQSAILNEQLKNVVGSLKAELATPRSPIRYSNGGYKVKKESRFKVYN